MNRDRYRLAGVVGVVVCSLGLLSTTSYASTSSTEGAPAPCLRPYETDVQGDYIPVSGDFNGDSVTDIVWYGPGKSYDTMWMSEFGRPDGCWSIVTINVDGDYIPVVGDYNGDWRDDIFWLGVGTQPERLWLGRAPNVGHPFRFQNDLPDIRPSDAVMPFSGEFSADGSDELFVYDPGRSAHTVVETDSRWALSDPFNWWATPLASWNESEEIVNGVYTPIVGAFDNSGRARDIFWDAPGGAEGDTHWYGLDLGGFRPCWINCRTAVVGDWHTIVADFDKDGVDDMFHSAYDPLPIGVAGREALSPPLPRSVFWRIKSAHSDASAWHVEEAFGMYSDFAGRPIVLDSPRSPSKLVWFYRPGPGEGTVVAPLTIYLDFAVP